ncbi:PilZ domain-containing protein [Sphingomonas sp. F9_3S_D5_B_2]
MTAVRALLDAKPLAVTGRAAPRRKLHLQAQGVVGRGTTDVLIMDVSTTGILLRTTGDLTNGETIELDMGDQAGIPAVVRWSSGDLFGCQFKRPLSTAAVSAALLRAPPAVSWPAPAPVELAEPESSPVEQLSPETEISFPRKMRAIFALALASWGLVAAAIWVVWQFV